MDIKKSGENWISKKIEFRMSKYQITDIYKLIYEYPKILWILDI